MSSNTLSRRDFMKLSGLGLASLMAPPLDIEIDEDTLESEKKDSVNIFDIENEISLDDIEFLNQTFESIALETVNLRIGPELSDSEKLYIYDFEPSEFIENSKIFIDSFVRIKKVYKEIDDDNNLDPDIQKESKQLIRNTYSTLRPIIEVIYNQAKKKNGRDLVLALGFIDSPIQTSDVPIDPLIGKEIYSQIGMQPWFFDFECKASASNNQVVGTYPFTRRFFYNSGEYLRTFASEFGSKSGRVEYEKKQIQPGKIEESVGKELKIDESETYQAIAVDDKVQLDIMKELEECGLDKSFINLVFSESTSIFGIEGGFVPNGEGTPQYKYWINIVMEGIEVLDEKTYFKNKESLLYIIKHEIFHVLVGRISEMSDKDAYVIYGTLSSLYRSVNSIYNKKEILNDVDLNIIAEDDVKIPNAGIPLTTEIIKHPNESLRERYFASLNTYGVSMIMERLLRRYAEDYNNGEKPWRSQLFDVQFEEVDENLDMESKRRIFEKNMQWLVNHLKSTYQTDSKYMSEVEKYIIESIIDRSEKGSLWSEITYWGGGSMNINSYTHYQLPGIIIYGSILRGDNKFTNALVKDYQKIESEGKITENRKMFVLRELGFWFNRIISENNGNPGYILHEYMADQFALSFTDKLGLDFRNLKSSLKARSIISKMRPIFKDLLAFFKERNLAKASDLI